MGIQNDIDKLIMAYQKKGYKISGDQAEELWDNYSLSLYATWIFMPDNLDELFEMTKEFAQEQNVI